MSKDYMQALYHNLCTQFCGLVDIAPHQWQTEGDLTTLSIELDEVKVSLSFSTSCPDTLLVVGLLGAAVPEAELATTRTLLEANYYLLGRSPLMFSRHPHSGEILLQYSVALQECSPHALRDSIVNLVRLAHHWRREGLKLETALVSKAPDMTRMA